MADAASTSRVIFVHTVIIMRQINLVLPQYEDDSPNPMIDRVTQIRDFEQRFGCAPAYQVFSPGRVNLIGEHTDYNMLPVLPMAINHGLSIIAAPSDDGEVRVENCDAAYPGVAFELAPEIAPSPNG